MLKTALIYHDDYLKHDAGKFHPERKERLEATMEFLRRNGILDKIISMTPKPATHDDLLLAHENEYINFVQKLSRSEDGAGGFIDADTYIGPGTYEIARLAVGGEILAGRVVKEGMVDNAIAMVRPPGHHAKRQKGGGFCYFNNAAIMIRYLQKYFGLGRVFLFDWDAHAANGTMDIFYNDPSVLNVSIHQDPHSFYPGEGFIEQIGKGEGEGYSVNIPVPHGTGDADYLKILEEFVIPLMESFKPEMVVISAGEDSHRDDPMSAIELSDGCYGKMTQMILERANKLCDGNLVVELEGGYNIEALSKSIHSIVLALLGITSHLSDLEIKDNILSSTSEVLSSLKEIFSEYHPALY